MQTKIHEKARETRDYMYDQIRSSFIYGTGNSSTVNSSNVDSQLYVSIYCAWVILIDIDSDYFMPLACPWNQVIIQHRSLDMIKKVIHHNFSCILIAKHQVFRFISSMTAINSLSVFYLYADGSACARAWQGLNLVANTQRISLICGSPMDSCDQAWSHTRSFCPSQGTPSHGKTRCGMCSSAVCFISFFVTSVPHWRWFLLITLLDDDLRVDTRPSHSKCLFGGWLKTILWGFSSSCVSSKDKMYIPNVFSYLF